VLLRHCAGTRSWLVARICALLLCSWPTAACWSTSAVQLLYGHGAVGLGLTSTPQGVWLWRDLAWWLKRARLAGHWQCECCTLLRICMMCTIQMCIGTELLDNLVDVHVLESAFLHVLFFVWVCINCYVQL
jgi:hypothetical protein